MAVVAGEESGVGRSIEGVSSGQRCQSGEALAEWRSSEQVENGIASTSPPYWDTDDDDGGHKPSELFGKYTWKIEKFSQINKRELRSNAFEVGSYKWYILIYPQGCDVCNHLSLFLCVANHDKLLPGWSHFAQFTIAVVNKDPKKSKYSDTLHRFWKKEHDWGWKKFMELSKVLDGFIDADSLIIKAQVQVIRERADRPFRCLACNYRRELVRVYLTNVENICHRFVEERRNKLGKLIEDKVRWSSFRAFWLGLDQNARRHMSREKEDVILKVVVKHFFIEKDVTSTLVMDSLYSGLKALEGQIKCNKGRAKLLDAEETPAPIILVDQDTFLLVDDILLLLERASKEPLPPKDEKGPQNRTKDGNIGEENKDYIERDERRLTELGRRTVEIYVLAHIFSNKIEVAYQEAVALKRQEELIREEEAAWQAESELKARRGAFEKEKKTKKKQNKQKRNNRKGKDKAREERLDVAVQDKHQGNPSPEGKDSMLEELELLVVKPDVLEDISDLSDSVDGVNEVLQPDLEDRDGSPINWDTDASEVHPLTEACSSGIIGLSCIQNGMNRCPSPMDDSSSTCSTDSVPSVVLSGHYRGNSFPSLKNQKSSSRGKNRRKAASNRNSWENDMDNQHSRPAVDAGDADDASERDKLGEPEMEASDLSSQVRRKWSEQNVFKKEGALSPRKKMYQVDMERPSKDKTQTVASSPGSPPKNLPTKTVPPKSENHNTATLDFASVRKTSSNGVQHIDRAVHLVTSSSQISGVSKPETLRVAAPRMTEKAMAQQMSAMSRSSSAPLVPGPRPSAPVVSVVRTPTFLARSMSAAGRLGPEPSTATHSYVPQSYRNAIVGNHVASSVAGLTNANSPSSGVNLAPAYSQTPTLVSASMFLTDSSERTECSTRKSGFPFGMVTRDGVHNGSQWIDSSQREASRCMNYDPSTLFNNIQNLDLYNTLPIGSWDHLNSEYQTCSSGHRTEGFSAADELFPHLDIINELLDDEHVIGKEARVSSVFESVSHGPGLLNGYGQQFSYPNDPDLVSSIGSSNSSCRFDRTRSYLDDAFQRSYCSSGGHYESPREYVPHSNTVAFVNGQIDGLIPNQWQIPNSDLSPIGMSVDCDGHPYYSPDYTNLACGVNGYTVFRPSNGH